MSLLQDTHHHFVVDATAYEIAICHRGRWHQTKVDCSYDRALFLANNASRRSGLLVQVRDTAGQVLYESPYLEGQSLAS
jgi:hypothetical protein